MDRTEGDTGDGSPARPATGAPRRAGLLQARSRDTRRRLVRSALQLWSERGFSTGVEDTTVEEIAAAAGVTKGTFYFHFAYKEQILLEMGWWTAVVLDEETQRCLAANRSLDDSLHRVLRALERRISSAEPAAVGRALAEFRRPPRPDASGPVDNRPHISDALIPLFARAQERDEVTDQIHPAEMARILEALVLDSIMEWVSGNRELYPSFMLRMSILLAGLEPQRSLEF